MYGVNVGNYASPDWRIRVLPHSAVICLMIFRAWVQLFGIPCWNLYLWHFESQIQDLDKAKRKVFCDDKPEKVRARYANYFREVRVGEILGKSNLCWIHATNLGQYSERLTVLDGITSVVFHWGMPKPCNSGCIMCSFLGREPLLVNFHHPLWTGV